MKRNTRLFILCVFINLLIGNVVLLAIITEPAIIHRLLLSVCVTIVYYLTFFKLKKEKQTKIKTIILAVGSSVACMIIASVFTSVAMRLPMDNVFIAVVKGIIPLSVFGLVLSSPVWIFLALINFLCLHNMKHGLPKLNTATLTHNENRKLKLSQRIRS